MNSRLSVLCLLRLPSARDWALRCVLELRALLDTRPAEAAVASRRRLAPFFFRPVASDCMGAATAAAAALQVGSKSPGRGDEHGSH